MASGKQLWLGLAIGNSRRHWALFDGATLKETWDSDRNPNQPATRQEPPLPLVLASVVPQETALWQNYPDLRIITPDKLPLKGLYPTLGIDRALAVLGGGRVLGWPILAIDAGTALTFTGAELDGTLVGGAILPGLKLQLSSLAEKTAALPPLEVPPKLPQRWARSTPEAIYSGTIYTILAGIRDFIEAWQQQFPDSKIAITGGDRSLLLLYLQEIWPHLAACIVDAPHLIFWGMREWKLWADTAEF
jgi:type III pantothenate kinase